MHASISSRLRTLLEQPQDYGQDVRADVQNNLLCDVAHDADGKRQEQQQTLGDEAHEHHRTIMCTSDGETDVALSCAMFCVSREGTWRQLRTCLRSWL